MADIIARARKQRIFAVGETVKGTMVFPAVKDFILPAGNASMSQKPTFEDSMELHDTLDVLSRFEDSLPAGEFTLPMYLRPGGVSAQAELMPNIEDRDFSGASAWGDVDLVSGGGAYDETGDLTIFLLYFNSC